MARYLLKRVIQIIPVLLILTFIIFCLVYVAGDPVASIWAICCEVISACHTNITRTR